VTGWWAIPISRASTAARARVSLVAATLPIRGYRAELERSDVVIHTRLDKKRHRHHPRAVRGAARAPQTPWFAAPLHLHDRCSILGKSPTDRRAPAHPAHPLAFRRELEKEALALRRRDGAAAGIMYGNDGYTASAAMVALAESGNEPMFPGDRTEALSWIHIDDLAERTVWSLRMRAPKTASSASRRRAPARGRRDACLSRRRGQQRRDHVRAPLKGVNISTCSIRTSC